MFEFKSNSTSSGPTSVCQPLVSVITPVYNGEDFIAECIESVLAQTYQNWDYTIVNNCSNDRTLEIAQTYAARDPRIRVVNNQAFLPIIQNHNHALRHISAESKFCKVVLADDWLFPECIEKMVALAEANPSVGLVNAFAFDGVHVLWGGLTYPQTVVSGREVCRNRLLGRTYVLGPPTCLLIRSEFIRNQESFYDEWNLHSDSTACFRVLQNSDFGFVHQVLTFIRSRTESNTSFATRMDSFHLAWLTDLVQYGPGCLTEEQYQERLRVRLQKYYEALAQSALRLREKAYWQFHEDWLSKLGLRLSRGRLCKAICAAAVVQLMHPWRSARSLAHLWRRALSRTRRESGGTPNASPIPRYGA